MSVTENFLTTKEEQEIVNAIAIAEQSTSGEIRVHIESKLFKDAHERALEVFHLLEMDQTKFHNGILLYVAVSSKTFVIYGDSGIHKKVPELFWNETKNLVINHFSENEFKLGLVNGILEVGEKLKLFFPIQEEDRNELTNEISKN